MTYNDDTPIVMLSVSQLKNLFKEFASEAIPDEKKADNINKIIRIMSCVTSLESN